MAYFKIGNTDYSNCVNQLKVSKSANYSAQTNAAGNTVVDYINSKRVIEVGIIAIDNSRMIALQQAIAGFSVTISFRNPNTGSLESVSCIIPEDNVEYYTIQSNKVLYNAFNLQFIEL